MRINPSLQCSVAGVCASGVTANGRLFYSIVFYCILLYSIVFDCIRHGGKIFFALEGLLNEFRSKKILPVANGTRAFLVRSESDIGWFIQGTVVKKRAGW